MQPSGPTQATKQRLADIAAEVTANDSPRWMVTKDGLDHGPFSARELITMILKGDLEAHHHILNLDLRERKTLGEFSHFEPFLEQQKLHRHHQTAKHALAKSIRVEKWLTWVKFTLGLCLVATILFFGYRFITTRQEASRKAKVQRDLADLYERGEMRITGTAGILPQRGARGGRSGRNGVTQGSHNAGGGSGSYEQAMNRAIDMGDVTQDGSESQLSSQEVASIINGRVSTFGKCVSAELRSGSDISTVQIDISIAGSGSVLGSSVRQGSSTFKQCVESQVRQIRFPHFGAPRMGARYSFQVR